MDMVSVVVAFESAKSCERVREILESNGTAACILCRSAAEVKRVVNSQRIPLVVCGFKLPDEPCQSLYEDLPPTCAMLMVAVGSLLDLCQSEDIFQLPSPMRRGELIASVETLLQMDRRPIRPQRSGEEEHVVCAAKALLMDRHGITEEQAHRLLQKRSMDSGAKLVQAAQRVLDEQRGIRGG